MVASVDAGFVPVLAQWISDGLEAGAWLELVARVPGLEAGSTRIEVAVAH
jgi:hypothetical protein